MQHSRIRTLEPLPIPAEQHETESTIFDTISDAASRAWLYVTLIPHFTKLIYGVIMRDWKTTTTAVLGGLAAAINYWLGIVVPPEVIGFATMIVGFIVAGDGGKKND